MGRYTEEELDRLIDKAAERAVGIYMEETERRFDLVLEATGFINERLKDMVTRDEFNELRSEVRTIRYTLKDTNRDLRDWRSEWGS